MVSLHDFIADPARGRDSLMKYSTRLSRGSYFLARSRLIWNPRWSSTMGLQFIFPRMAILEAQSKLSKTGNTV